MTRVPPAKDIGEMEQFKLRRVAHWLALIGSAAVMLAALVFTFYQVWTADDLRRVVIEHFAAVVGLPSAALASLAIVVILQGTSGPIKFSGFGFSFEGAAGPIFFWVLCFLSIASAIRLLW